MSLLKKHSRPAPPDARWASRRARRVLHALLPLAAMAVLSGDAGTIGGSASGGPVPGARAAGTLFLSPGRLADRRGQLGERPPTADRRPPAWELDRQPALPGGLPLPLSTQAVSGRRSAVGAAHGLVRRRGQMGTTRRRSVNVLWGE